VKCREGGMKAVTVMEGIVGTAGLVERGNKKTS